MTDIKSTKSKSKAIVPAESTVVPDYTPIRHKKSKKQKNNKISRYAITKIARRGTVVRLGGDVPEHVQDRVIDYVSKILNKAFAFMGERKKITIKDVFNAMGSNQRVIIHGRAQLKAGSHHKRKQIKAKETEAEKEKEKQ